MSIRNATHFWMEAGGMSGPPQHRHQIEFSNDLAEFFTDDERDNEVIRMCLPGGPMFTRPLTYRGTDYGQWTEQWRLGLLTARMGGPQYIGQIVCFTRRSDANGTFYELEVFAPGSAQANQWEHDANTHGVVDETAVHHHRRYGYWS